MRKVSKRFRRAAALLALLTVFVTQGAMAAGRDSDRGWRDRIERAKRFVMTVCARFGWPPGYDSADPEPAEPPNARLSIPPG